MARTYRYLGRLDSAALLLREATGIYAAVAEPDTQNLVGAYADLCVVARNINDRQLSLSAADMIGGLLRQNSNINPYTRFIGYYTAGDTYLDFEDFERALPLADSAIRHSDPDDYTTLADAYNLKHVILGGLHREQEGEIMLGEVIDLYEKNDPNTSKLAILYVNRAYDAIDDGRFKAAIRDCERAISIEESKDDLIEHHTVLSKAYLLAGDKDGALTTLEKAFEYAENSVLTSPLFAMVRLYRARGRVHLARGDRNRALDDYRAASKLYDEYRERVTSSGSRELTSSYQREYLDKVVAICIDNYRDSGDQKWGARSIRMPASARRRLQPGRRPRRRPGPAAPAREIELRQRTRPPGAGAE